MLSLKDITNSPYKSILTVALTGFIAYYYLASGSGLMKIYVGGRKVYVELAVSLEERSRGLQFRKSMGEDRGMLFIFPQRSQHTFWMKDTLILLSLAFINENGLITQIEEMHPGSLERHTSRDKVKYALEMNSGWFKRNNVHIGDRVTAPSIINAGNQDE